jgi:OOP family OmpA-OmpF porin
MRVAWLVAVAPLVSPCLVLAQEGFAAPAGMATVHVAEASPDTYAPPLAPVGGDGPVTEPREGTVRWATFRGETPGTPLGAVDAISGALWPGDWRTVLDCADDACGGFDFILAIEVMRPPAMMVNPLDFHQRTLRGTDAAGGEVWVSVLASRFAGVTHAQTVTVTAPPPPPSALAPTPRPDDDGPASPVQPPVADVAGAPSLASRVMAALSRDGRVALEGIDFDTAAAEKTLADAPVIDAVAELLRARPELSLVVVGHSDGVGGLAPNVALSRERAEAVVAALEARGVAPGRLTAEGAGWLAPATANTSEAGRAVNRRVELVLR